MTLKLSKIEIDVLERQMSEVHALKALPEKTMYELCEKAKEVFL